MAKNKPRIKKQRKIPRSPSKGVQAAGRAETTTTDRPALHPVSVLDSAFDSSLLLTIPEVCLLLKLSRSTLDRMAKTDSIPGRIKIGGQVRYHRKLLEQWLLSQILS